jgi:hypothetical protein
MKAELSAIFILNDKVFGPLSPDRARQRLIQILSSKAGAGKAIESIIIEKLNLSKEEGSSAADRA